MKAYQVSDLFHTAWADITPAKRAAVFRLFNSIQDIKYIDGRYGHTLIAILRLLRKNKRLVDRISEAQAVDIFNDLAFLKTPWYFFPRINHELLAQAPADKLARTTFDQFIHADNEYTGFMAAEADEARGKFLRRLAVTLYCPEGETAFDKELVETRSERIAGVDLATLLNVFYAYGHVRNFVTARCKTLLPAPPKAADDLPQKPQQTGPMWYRMKHLAAKTLVFGDFDTLGKTNMYSVLDHLEILAQEQEERDGKS